jgi:hypothetical protein
MSLDPVLTISGCLTLSESLHLCELQIPELLEMQMCAPAPRMAGR